MNQVERHLRHPKANRVVFSKITVPGSAGSKVASTVGRWQRRILRFRVPNRLTSSRQARKKDTFFGEEGLLTF